VDDLLIMSEDKIHIDNLCAHLETAFDIGSQGPTEWLLKIQVIKTSEYTWIGQPNYSQEILELSGMWANDQITPKPTPMIRKWKHDPLSPILNASQHAAYRSITMKLSYLAQKTRPDLCFAIRTLAMYQVEPREENMNALVRVLRYLLGTHDWGLMYKAQNKPERLDDGTYLCRNAEHMPVVYADASHGEGEERSSRTGIITMYAGAAITWQSKKQTSVSLSSTESEIYALSEGVKQGIWCERFAASCRLIGPGYFITCQDNQSAIDLVENPTGYPRAKHMNLRYRFIGNLTLQRQLLLKWVPTELMLADICTKPLEPKQHHLFCETIGLIKRPLEQSL
jgi:hypothetical protein